jgi:CDP-diacylglycerol---serine O-phosphatidyltransferase
MKIRQHIPNSLTILNLASGFIAITMAMEHNLTIAALLILVAAVFDFLDGTAARLLKAYSELGKQLDSLADVISFGVAPGIIVFQLLSVHCEGGCNILERMHIIPYFALLIPVCAALRLGKFNIDLNQEVNFTGLPTPANAIFFASIPLVLNLQSSIFTMIRLDFMVDFFSNPRVLAILTVFLSYLMVSDFRLFSMKFKTSGWKENNFRYLFLGLSVFLVVLFSLSAIPLIILGYLLLSMIFQKQI